MMAYKAFKQQVTVAVGIEGEEYDSWEEEMRVEMGQTHKPYFNIEVYTAQKSF